MTNGPEGKPIWLNMDQAQLDDADDQLKYAPNRDQIIRRYANRSEEARSQLGPPKRLTYGISAIEGLDLYPTVVPGALCRFLFTAELGEADRPATTRSRQSCLCAPAPIFLPSISGDPDRIYITGHSSGAHLASVTTVTDWENDYDLPIDVLKGALQQMSLIDHHASC